MTKEELKALRGDALTAGNFMSVRGVLAGILDHLISEAEKPKERWRAKEGGKYWYVDSDGDVDCDYDGHIEFDGGRYSIGNYYRTEDEAKAAAERVRKAYVV